MSNTQPPNPLDRDAKRHARLAAVQALYQIALTQIPVAQVIQNFRDHPPMLAEEDTAPILDFDLFPAIVTGVTESETELDELIAGAVDAKVSVDRLEALLRAILRAGAFELHRHGPIPAAVIINDYVDVAHAFYGGKEPGLINAVLDKLAKNLRTA